MYIALSEQEIAACDEQAKKAMEALGPGLQKTLATAIDTASENIMNYVQVSMEGDLAYNFQQMVQSKVEAVMSGLLNEGGMNCGWDLAEAQKFITNYSFREYRRLVYEAHKDVIHNQIIEDLTAENKQLKETIEFHSRMRGY